MRRRHCRSQKDERGGWAGRKEGGARCELARSSAPSLARTKATSMELPDDRSYSHCGAVGPTERVLIHGAQVIVGLLQGPARDGKERPSSTSSGPSSCDHNVTFQSTQFGNFKD